MPKIFRNYITIRWYEKRIEYKVVLIFDDGRILESETLYHYSHAENLEQQWINQYGK